MYDCGTFWNFERSPELTRLTVKRLRRPNPISKAVGASIVGLNRSKNGRFCSSAGLAVPRTKYDQRDSQKAIGTCYASVHPDWASHLLAERPVLRTGPVLAQAHEWNCL